MKLSELIRKKRVATLTLATPATVSPVNLSSVAGVATVTVANDETDWTDIAEQPSIKPLSIQDRQREARRQKVLAMLESAAPETKRIVYVDTDSDCANAILAIAIRDIVTFEMTIPKADYDAWRLLELIERMGADTTH